MTDDVGPPSLTNALLRAAGRSPGAQRGDQQAVPATRALVPARRLLLVGGQGRTWTLPPRCARIPPGGSPTGTSARASRRTGGWSRSRGPTTSSTGRTGTSSGGCQLGRRCDLDGPGGPGVRGPGRPSRDVPGRPGRAGMGRPVRDAARSGRVCRRSRRAVHRRRPRSSSTRPMRPPARRRTSGSTGDELVEMGTWTYGLRLRRDAARRRRAGRVLRG